MKAKIERFSPYARIPEKARLGSACFDLYSARIILLEPNKTKKIETVIGFMFSSKYTCEICPRSCMSLKGVVLRGGVVDLDVRGNVAVILTNTSDRIVEIEVGERIAQAFFLKKVYVKFEEVSELDCTVRGEKGFGSTNK